MKNDQNLLFLKEKLKIKEREISQLQSAKQEKDREISDLQSVKQEWEDKAKSKINEMEGVIAEQQKIIGKATNESPQGDNRDPDQKLLVKIEEEKSKYKKLEDRNNKLSKSLKVSDKSIKKLNKHISILVKEYKRLKESQKDKIVQLMEGLEEGKKNNEDMKKNLNLANEEKIKIEEELEAQKSAENKSSNSGDKARLEAMIRAKESLESQVIQLTDSLETSKEQAQKLLKEREGLQEIMIAFEKDSDAGSNKNLESLVKGQIENLTNEAESHKKKAEGLLKEVAELKKGISKEPNIVEQKIIEEDDEGGGEGGAPAWMCTFADMVTLLMVFFVIFYSVNADNTAKMLSVIEGTEDKSLAIGVLEALDEITIKKKLNDLVGLGPGKGQFESQVEAELKKDLEKAKIEGADVGRNGKKIFVNVPANNLFKPGSADLTKQAIPILNKLSQTFLKFPDYKINISGHTDDESISTARFPSNWELSSSRATAVLRLFADKGIDPLKMTATGRSDLFPLYSNSTELGRSKNRRVEFKLEKEKKE